MKPFISWPGQMISVYLGLFTSHLASLYLKFQSCSFAVNLQFDQID